MFGFGKKKAPPPPREKRQRTSDKEKTDYRNDLEKLGLLGIVGGDGFDSDGNGTGTEDSEPDERDLEDELMAIIGEDLGSTDALISPLKVKSTAKIACPAADEESSMSVPAPSAENQQSIFNSPPPPATVSEALDQRLEKYKAELEKATIGNEGATKVRRIGRIVKQYEDAITAHEKGRPVAFEDLPTPPGFGPIPVPAGIQAQSTPVSSKTDVTPESVPPAFLESPRKVKEESFPDQSQVIMNLVSGEPEAKVINQPQDEQLQAILTRQKQYKEAAVMLKRRGDIEQAKMFLRTAKGLDALIQASREGLPVDMAQLPSPPCEKPQGTPTKGKEDGDDELLQLSLLGTVGVDGLRNDLPGFDFNPYERKLEKDLPPPSAVGNPGEIPTPPDTSLPPGPPTEITLESVFHAPPPPSTVEEALDQRLIKYRAELEKATNGNEGASKVRRMGRIVKQYEDAIAAHKKGRPVAFEDLPTPPGYAPIPTGVPVASASVPGPAASASSSPPQLKPSTEGSSPSQGHTSSINRGANKPQTKLTLQEKQLQAIVARQKQFKDAAINAKQRGDIGQAKEFLRTAKGFDKLIQASEAGLPVDMATLPSSPNAVASLALETSDDFDIVHSSDCVPPPTGSAAEIFSRLEEDLREQLKMCMRTRDHFKSMGDIASGNRFEKLAIETKKDLDTLRLSMKQDGVLPKYHFETRTFSITECNSDLADDEIEISILRGINFNVPNPAEVDTFIKVEFPYPSAEEAQFNKTAVIRDTNNPDYEATFKMKINRTARPFQRFIHRHGVKLELWSKGGFLRSSTLLGTSTVKLLPLETKCTLHDAFDVLEGRKVVGKVEVKVRLREPILTKQITQKKEKWLSIDRV